VFPVARRIALKTSQELLGHSDLETTLNVYTHAIPDAQRSAVERVGRVLDPVGPKRDFERTRGERVN
jgi:integrase